MLAVSVRPPPATWRGKRCPAESCTVALTAPVRHGFETGSFPDLSFNGGAARITVRTDPLANLLASDLADFNEGASVPAHCDS